MKRFKTQLTLMFVTLSLLGCKKEDPNPELLDPIYQDLSSRASGFQKAYEDEVNGQKALEAALEKAEPNTPELRNARRDLEKSQAKRSDLEQKALYYKIRAQRRLLVDRITYKQAFARNEKWPDPHEYSEYQVNTRLREANLNWGSRVPKLQDRLVSGQSKGQKDKESAPKGEE